MNAAGRYLVVTSLMLMTSTLQGQGRSVEEVQGSSGDSIRSAADSLWRPIEVLIQQLERMEGKYGPAFQALRERDPALESYGRIWLEVTSRMLREVGLTFYDRFPDDPRRWRWVRATIQVGDQTLYIRDISDPYLRQGTVLDTAAMREWDRRKPKLIKEMLASSQVSDTEKAEMVLFDFMQRARSAGRSRQNDLRVWAEELLEIVKRYPATRGRMIRVPVLLIADAARRDAEHGPTVIERLRGSGVDAIKTLIDADVRIAEARRTPMTLERTAIDGKPLSLAQFRGKVVLLELTGYTWCGACRIAEKQMLQMYPKLKVRGFEIVSVAIEFEPESKAFVKAYLDKHGIAWPHIFTDKGSEDELMVHFGNTGVPRFFLFDQNGLLVHETHGSNGPRDLEPVIDKLLGKKKGA